MRRITTASLPRQRSRKTQKWLARLGARPAQRAASASRIGEITMTRRILLAAIAAALTVSAPAALAQEPMVFGVITPLSPPGETSLGQQDKRGSEIAVEYLNEKGGVLGRKVVL